MSAPVSAAEGEMARRAAPLELDPERFREMGHRLVDELAHFLETLPERAVSPATTPAAIRAKLGGDRPLPIAGADPAEILSEATELLLESSTFNGHPRFFGYITSSAAPLGALADLLASALNQNVGAWGLSPMATEIERQTVKWIAELLGYPRECGGLLVSGGNMANLVCALAGLRAVAKWDVRSAGVAGSVPGRLMVYATTETHTWVDKLADLSGLGTGAIRRIDCDAQGRMLPDALRSAIAEERARGSGDGAAVSGVVIGSAGTVSTGVVDPLSDLAAICAENGLWFHADGAYGAPAAALPDAHHDLKALSLADSVAVDPHKWLYAPLEAGCVLVRDAEALRRTFSFRPPYYHFTGSAEDPPTNFFEWGPQNSRGFRALKVWLGLRQAGRDGIVASIGEDIALARRLHDNVSRHPELEALTCELSIATFRFVPASLREMVGVSAEAERYLNELNEALLTETQAEGETYLSNAVIGGRYALRACIVNFRTTAADVDEVPEIFVRAGRALDGRMRPPSLRR